MTVLRPVLVGLGVGAAVAFLAALLGPRRRREPIDVPDPDPDVDALAGPAPTTSRSTSGAT